MKLHPSVILWLSVLYYLHPTVVLPFLGAVLVHESGHLLVLLILKKAPKSITFGFRGAVIETPPLSYPQEILAAAGGPAASLLFGMFTPLFPDAGVYSLWLGLVNLFPAAGLDGGRMLHGALMLTLPPQQAEKAEKTVGITAGGILLMVGTFVSAKGSFGLWPLFLSAIFFLRVTRTL